MAGYTTKIKTMELPLKRFGECPGLSKCVVIYLYGYKMAYAGFAYTPQHPGDDLATCLYCNISLSGWETDDDPMYDIHP